jgi:hypothetical protein
LSFCPWLCCVLGGDSGQTADERQTIGRRDELVHVLHLLRLPCPHKGSRHLTVLVMLQ